MDAKKQKQTTRQPTIVHLPAFFPEGSFCSPIFSLKPTTENTFLILQKVCLPSSVQSPTAVFIKLEHNHHNLHFSGDV